MKKVLLIGHLDLRIFLKDKSGWFWLFIAPALFIFFFGFANRPPGDPSNPRPGVLIENLDRGNLGAVLLAELGEQGLELLGPAERDEARRGLRIPEDFSEKVRAGETVDVEFFKIEESATAIESMVELRLGRALVSLNTELFRLVVEGGELAGMEASTLTDRLGGADPVSLTVEWGSRKPLPHGYNQTLPGTLVMFLLLNLTIFGASGLSQARLTGVMKRLAVYPLSKGEVVTGKIYGLFLLALIQIAVFLLLGEFVFSVEISHNPVGIALVLFLFSWMAASLGVLIGAYVTSPEKTYGICIGGSLIIAAFGGCWWPLEILSEELQLFAQLFPTAWAMGALNQLISFGADTGHILPELGVLFLFALAAHAVASLSLRYQ